MLTASNLPPRENETGDAGNSANRGSLEAFEAAVEAGEETGFQDGAMRSHGGT